MASASSSSFSQRIQELRALRNQLSHSTYHKSASVPSNESESDREKQSASSPAPATTERERSPEQRAPRKEETASEVPQSSPTKVSVEILRPPSATVGGASRSKSPHEDPATVINEEMTFVDAAQPSSEPSLPRDEPARPPVSPAVSLSSAGVDANRLHRRYIAAVQLLAESLEEQSNLRALMELTTSPHTLSPAAQDELLRLMSLSSQTDERESKQDRDASISFALVRDAKIRALQLQQDQLLAQTIELRAAVDDEKQRKTRVEADLKAANALLEDARVEIDRLYDQMEKRETDREWNSAPRSPVGTPPLGRTRPKERFFNRPDKRERMQSDAVQAKDVLSSPLLASKTAETTRRKTERAKAKENLTALEELDMDISPPDEAKEEKDRETLPRERSTVQPSPQKENKSPRREPAEREASVLLEIDLDEHRRDTIVVKPSSDPLALTLAFMEKHSLPESYFEPLVQYVTQTQEQLLRETGSAATKDSLSPRKRDSPSQSDSDAHGRLTIDTTDIEEDAQEGEEKRAEEKEDEQRGGIIQREEEDEEIQDGEGPVLLEPEQADLEGEEDQGEIIVDEEDDTVWPPPPPLEEGLEDEEVVESSFVEDEDFVPPLPDEEEEEDGQIEDFKRQEGEEEEEEEEETQQQEEWTPSHLGEYEHADEDYDGQDGEYALPNEEEVYVPFAEGSLSQSFSRFLSDYDDAREGDESFRTYTGEKEGEEEHTHEEKVADSVDREEDSERETAETVSLEVDLTQNDHDLPLPSDTDAPQQGSGRFRRIFEQFADPDVNADAEDAGHGKLRAQYFPEENEMEENLLEEFIPDEQPTVPLSPEDLETERFRENENEIDLQEERKQEIPPMMSSASPSLSSYGTPRRVELDRQSLSPSFHLRSLSRSSSPFPPEKSIQHEELGEIVDVAQNVLLRAHELRDDGQLQFAIPLYYDALRLLELSEFNETDLVRQDVDQYVRFSPHASAERSNTVEAARSLDLRDLSGYGDAEENEHAAYSDYVANTVNALFPSPIPSSQPTTARPSMVSDDSFDQLAELEEAEVTEENEQGMGEVYEDYEDYADEEESPIYQYRTTETSDDRDSFLLDVQEITEEEAKNQFNWDRNHRNFDSRSYEENHRYRNRFDFDDL